MTMTIEDFVRESRALLGPLLTKPGAVLYSSAATLRPGRFYFLGVNPGGANDTTLDASLSKLPGLTINAYTDEDWSTQASAERRRRTWVKGGHMLQKNAQLLFQTLGTPVQHVCASNLMFPQTPTEDRCEKAWADQCWPVHELIMNIVRPQVVITFGSRAYDYVTARRGALKEHETSIGSGHGKWRCRSTQSDGLTIIGLPHLSRYSLAGRTAVLEWIKQLAR
jgi:uracil-DNA glycosylase